MKEIEVIPGEDVLVKAWIDPRQAIQCLRADGFRLVYLCPLCATGGGTPWTLFGTDRKDICTAEMVAGWLQEIMDHIQNSHMLHEALYDGNPDNSD